MNADKNMVGARTYEIRTRKDKPVFVFDTLGRAQAEIVRAQQRLRIPLKLVEITRQEREISAVGAE